MSAPAGATRRRFLVSLCVFGAGGVALWIRRGSPGTGGRDPRLPEEFELALSGVANDPAAAREIGAAYLAEVPAERSEAALTAAIFAGEAWRDVAVEQAARQFHAQVRGDFEAGRTIALAGWVLAVSEARACALVEQLVGSGRLEFDLDS